MTDDARISELEAEVRRLRRINAERQRENDALVQQVNAMAAAQRRVTMQTWRELDITEAPIARFCRN